MLDSGARDPLARALNRRPIGDAWEHAGSDAPTNVGADARPDFFIRSDREPGAHAIRTAGNSGAAQ